MMSVTITTNGDPRQTVFRRCEWACQSAETAISLYQMYLEGFLWCICAPFRKKEPVDVYSEIKASMADDEEKIRISAESPVTTTV